MTEPGSKRREYGSYGKIRKLAVGLMLLCAAGSVVGFSGFLGGMLVSIVTGCAFTLLLLVAGVAHFILSSYVPTRRGLTRSAIGGAVDLDSIRGRTAELLERIKLEQIEQYVRFMLEPGEIRGRLIEEIEPLKRTLKQRVKLNLEIPPEWQKQDLLFPVLMPVKGELQDHLVIALDGKPVATLTYQEYLVLTSLVLEALLVPSSQLSGREAARLRVAANRALGIVTKRGRLAAAERAKVDDCADEIKSLAGKGGKSLLLAASLIRRLAENYAIVVVIPAAEVDRRQVTYERSLIPSLHLAGHKSPLRWFRDRIGMLLGTRPVHLTLGVENAATAKSYHLFVTGPDGTYVGWQDMPDPDGIFEVKSLGEDLEQPYGRFRRRLGQRYLHLYMRSIPERFANKLRLDVRFFEVPPGSMAAATLAAAANLALLLLVALIFPGGERINSDFPAVVLAFPAIAGAFVGFESRTNSLVGGTLSSRSSSLLTVLLSLAASGIFLGQSAGSFRWPVGQGVFGIKDMWWQVLVVLALLNTGYALYVWISRTATFYWLAMRRDDLDVGPSEH